MQTFVPYDDVDMSARCLDRLRLGKQRVEVLQILRSLRGVGGWGNHPAVKMWSGHEGFLADYGAAVCREWLARGYKDTCLEKIRALAGDDHQAPPWWGGEIHPSHRAALLHKHPEHYLQFGWSEEPALAYHWPKR